MSIEKVSGQGRRTVGKDRFFQGSGGTFSPLAACLWRKSSRVLRGKKNMTQNAYYMNAYIEKSEKTKCATLVDALKKSFAKCVDEYSKS